MTRPPLYWTRELIIVALQDWYATHGRAPAKRSDWGRAAPDHPASSSVDGRFGSWNAAIEAAGLPTNKAGLPNRQSRDEIAGKILDWKFAHGAWPTEVEWDRAGMAPAHTTVIRLFGSWHEARRFAGWRSSCANCDKQLPKGRRRWCSERCRNAVYRHGFVVAVEPVEPMCVGCGTTDLDNNVIGCHTCSMRADNRMRRDRTRAAAKSGLALGVVESPNPTGDSDAEADGNAALPGQPVNHVAQAA